MCPSPFCFCSFLNYLDQLPHRSWRKQILGIAYSRSRTIGTFLWVRFWKESDYLAKVDIFQESRNHMRNSWDYASPQMFCIALLTVVCLLQIHVREVAPKPYFLKFLRTLCSNYVVIDIVTSFLADWVYVWAMVRLLLPDSNLPIFWVFHPFIFNSDAPYGTTKNQMKMWSPSSHQGTPKLRVSVYIFDRFRVVVCSETCRLSFLSRGIGWGKGDEVELYIGCK